MPPNNNENKLQPLSWQVPIVNPNGTPTQEFMRKWAQQMGTNATIIDLTTTADLSSLLDLLGSAQGDVIFRGASAWTVLAPGTAGYVLKSGGPAADPLWDSISHLLDQIGAVKGMVLYRGTTNWQALAVPTGHDGWVLTWNDGAAAPEWRAASGGGGGASSFWIDVAGNYYVALVDPDGQMVLDGSGNAIYTVNPQFGTAPTFTTLNTVTTGNYTPPAGCIRIEIEMKGAGGGSNSQGGGNPGGDGANASFNSITAEGGKGATSGGIGTAGAGGSAGTGTAVWRRRGQSGFSPTTMVWDATTSIVNGGHGGGDGAPAPGSGVSAAAVAAGANTGAGAAGANTLNLVQASLAAITWSAGGGEGEIAFVVIDNPVGPYAWVVPDGGAGGTGGGTTTAGAKGGSGYIRIKEIYK